MKKQKAKESKKGATKKKEDKPTTSAKTDESEPGPADDGTEPAPQASEEKPAETDEASKAEAEDVVVEDAPPKLARQPSVSMQSKQRSESFRNGSVLSPVATDLRAGSGPTSPGLEVQELYKKQAGRIEELERENRAYKEQQEEGAARLAKAEGELESLREGSSDLAELKSRANQADKLTAELASVQRQLVQAQQAAKGQNRRVSGTSPDVSQELASKTATIESLELEISNLRNQVNNLTTTITEREASAKELEERATTAEGATEAAKQELDALKVSIAFPSEDTKAAGEDPEVLTKRISILESDLRTANNNADSASQRATSLEQKIEALTKLHREASTTSQAKDRELNDLRAQTKRRDRGSHVRDASDFDLQDEETETGQLHARIRALEAENFDLRRGVWRDKRAELQPGISDGEVGHGQEYEDVDLNGPYTPQRGSLPRQGSTFQDVISSGISAFTGRPREPTGARGSAGGGNVMSPHARKQSLGLMSEDGFDEDAFRIAQEEEAKRRIERVKEVKRGLEQWRGWRVDIVDVRRNGLGGGREAGPVFDV